MLKVNTIYPAFMGEVNCHGIGVPCTFIRLAGCNLRCYFNTKGTYCDTPEALNIKSGKDMLVTDILTEVDKLGRKVICLTGGEPLMQDVSVLLGSLSKKGYYVVIETNGTKDISLYKHYKNVSFVVDYKSKSSGERINMLPCNWGCMDSNDYLKFVIDDEEDYIEAKEWLGCNPTFKGNVAFGLFWGSKLGYQELMNLMVRDRLQEVFLNMQVHKMACLYDEKKKKEDLSKIFIPKNL